MSVLAPFFIDRLVICEEENEIGNKGKEVFIMLLDCVGRTKEDIGRDVEDWRRRTKITQTELAHMIELSSDKAYRRICIDCTAEFPQKSLRLLAKLMNVSVDFLIPDAEFEEDEAYIKNIIKRGITFSHDQVTEIMRGESQPNLSELEKRLVRMSWEILNIKEEGLKEELVDQLELTLKIAKRASV